MDVREYAKHSVREAVAQGRQIVTIIEQDGIKGLPTAELEVKKAGRCGKTIDLIYGTRINSYIDLENQSYASYASTGAKVLIPINREGYSNLCEIITLAYRDGSADEPKVTLEDIAARKKGLIWIDDSEWDLCLRSEIRLAEISDKISERPLFPRSRYMPVIERAGENLKASCVDRARRIYGELLPPSIEIQLEKELDAISANGYEAIFYIAKLMTDKAREDGQPFGFRGAIGSSLAAYFAGITEVNPLPPHYVCSDCGHYEEPIERTKYETCWELPKRVCPHCGKEMKRDGYNIPLEVLFGYRMDREPDIDFNFAPDYRNRMQNVLAEHFGEDHVIRCGVCRSDGKTGIHPGGCFIVPDQYEITDFTPLQRVNIEPDDDRVVTHIDYHDVDYPLLKMDLLTHDSIRILRDLKDATGVDPEDIPLDDKDTLEFLTHVEDDSSEYDMYEKNSLVEFGSDLARHVIKATDARSFADLVRVDGLIHGTDTWSNNAELLISEGTASLREVISTRDDIMNYMLELSVDREKAYIIMDTVRKGRNLKEEQWQMMKDHGVPNWFLFSCCSVKYMFPRAHVVAYTMMAVRLAWYKVHYPDIYEKVLAH